MTAESFQLLVSDDWGDYALLDSGDMRKLERFGKVRVNRPDPQALWKPKTPVASWKADATFASKDDEDERGAWSFAGKPPPDEWPIAWNTLKLNARLAAFRHMGVFPEHSVHWRWAADQVKAAKRPVKALNLFGYTGMMSLALAQAGAEVVHLDASPKSIAQGRENAAMSGLEDAPIRWICDDAMKFIEREMRRGSKYDAIVLDPPKFGRGPKNETWRFETDYPKLLEHVRALMSDKPLFVIATVYAVRLSYAAVGQSLAGAMGGGNVVCGEMAIRESSGRNLVLPTGLFARWTP
ncbi:MAG TPA: class I SAM-dependent methyltransferase [Hyphomonadaceae bacterium]|nr:class I SAM-dependent methyltransferase [Hyphomonadaceae bacterium]